MSFVAELIRCNFAIAQALAYVDGEPTSPIKMKRLGGTRGSYSSCDRAQTLIQ